MTNISHVTALELIETYAEAHDRKGYVIDEEHLSDLFDEAIPELSDVVSVQDYDLDSRNYDPAPILSAFKEFASGLVQEGKLHPVQQESYRYVGQYC